MKHRQVREGDIGSCWKTDPWTAVDLHQNDVHRLPAIFHEGQSRPGRVAGATSMDLGGVVSAPFLPGHAQGRFSEAVPTPPVKVVRDF